MFRAQQAEWGAAKAYSDANSGFLSAIGGMSGSLGPGQAPTGMGMAWGGGLGGEAQAAARAASGVGAISANTFAWSGSLNQFGSSWVQAGYQAKTLGAAWNESIRFGNDFHAEVSDNQGLQKALDVQVMPPPEPPKKP